MAHGKEMRLWRWPKLQKTDLELLMGIRAKSLTWALLMLVAASGAGVTNDSALAAEIAKSNAGGSMLQIWPEIDPGSLTYNTTDPFLSRPIPNHQFSREMAAGRKGYNLELKTDLEVDVKKFMPPDTRQQMLFDNTVPLNGTHPAMTHPLKSIPFLGLSASKPIN